MTSPMGIFLRACLVYLVISSFGVAYANQARPLSARTTDPIVYHGKVLKPNNKPVDGRLVLNLTILSPEPSLCILWAETIVTNAKNGGFSVEIGHTENRRQGIFGGAALIFRDVFLNHPGLLISNADCAVGNSFSPTYTDDRLLKVAFEVDGEVVSAENIPIKAVPYAKQAQEISGYGLSNLMKISGAGSSVIFTPDETASLKDLLGGDIDWDLKGRRGTNLADPVALSDAATMGWVQSAISSNGPGISSGADAAKPAGSSGEIYVATDTRIMYRHDGTSWAPLTGTQATTNEILFSTGSSTVTGIAPANNAVLLSNGSGVPAWGAISNDTFLQYALLAGRAGGQTLVGGTGGGDNLTLNSTSNSAKGNVLLSTDGGNVGIGTASPSQKLEIMNGNVQLTSGGNAFLGQTFTNLASTGAIFRGERGRGSVGSGSAPNAGDVLAQFEGGNYIRSGKSGMSIVATENHTSNSGSALAFSTVPNASTTASESMRIDHNGKVGIGTTSPGDKLHVEGKIRAQEICDENGVNCKDISGGWTAGSVTSVSAGGLPLTVTSGSSTPQISIAQAGAAQAGYLSSTDWNSFNSKQPAGNYLTSIVAEDVNTALGFTPVSNTLASGQVYVGNGSSVASAGFFGIAQMKNNLGTTQFPSTCAASQTLTWSAITDVLSCTNIGSLPASAISSGTIDSARLPFSSSLWQDGGSGKVYYNGGNVGVGTTSPARKLHVEDPGGGIMRVSTSSTSYTDLFDDSTTMTLRKVTSAANIMDFHPSPTDGTSAATIRLFRSTNTTGAKSLQIYKGDNTATVDTQFSAAGANSYINANGGNVGIGTTNPNGTLQVNGTINGRAAVLNGSTTIDFSTGNLQYTNLNCQAFALDNVKDGGAYTLVIKGTSATTCSFTAFTGAGTGALTVHLPVGHAAAVTGTHTMYNFMVLGADLYVAWVPGY